MRSVAECSSGVATLPKGFVEVPLAGISLRQRGFHDMLCPAVGAGSKDPGRGPKVAAQDARHRFRLGQARENRKIERIARGDIPRAMEVVEPGTARIVQYSSEAERTFPESAM